MILSEYHRKDEERQYRHLRQRTLLIDGVHHFNVEGGRLIEAAHGMVKQDVGVFEEPGDDEQSQRNSDEPSFNCDEEQEREDQDNGCSSAPRRANEVMEQFEVSAYLHQALMEL